mmetsp:Transcript_64660/g.180744  ORF Transcript_64660/g.180744 Transcript_64660/m.180744 type:complete len:205 (+) Transcript_64660:179-793(+)
MVVQLRQSLLRRQDLQGGRGGEGGDRRVRRRQLVLEERLLRSLLAVSRGVAPARPGGQGRGAPVPAPFMGRGRRRRLLVVLQPAEGAPGGHPRGLHSAEGRGGVLRGGPEGAQVRPVPQADRRPRRLLPAKVGEGPRVEVEEEEEEEEAAGRQVGQRPLRPRGCADRRRSGEPRWLHRGRRRRGRRSRPGDVLHREERLPARGQ